MLLYWVRKSGFCESKFHGYEIYNVLSSMAYCLAGAVLLIQIFVSYASVLRKSDGMFLATAPIILVLLGIFSGVFHGQLYTIWGKADCTLILQVCIYTQSYLCLRIFAHNKKEVNLVSSYVLVLFLLFLSYLLNTLSFAFGFGLVFSYMVGANVAMISLLLLVLCLLTGPSEKWRNNFFLLVVSFFCFVTATLFWYLLDQNCQKNIHQTGHPLWHLFSAVALYLLFLFLIRLR